MRFRLRVGMVVVWAGWLNRLEEGSASLSVGGSQSRVMGVQPGVDGREGVGARVLGGVLADVTREEGAFADSMGTEDGSDLSETGVGGGAPAEGLADD